MVSVLLIANCSFPCDLVCGQVSLVFLLQAAIYIARVINLCPDSEIYSFSCLLCVVVEIWSFSFLKSDLRVGFWGVGYISLESLGLGRADCGGGDLFFLLKESGLGFILCQSASADYGASEAASRLQV